MCFKNKKDIKYYVKNFILANANQFKDKEVLDLPAGNGFTSEVLHSIGAKVTAMDLFPDLFKVNDINCQYCNLEEQIPANDHCFDYIFCQEGIEHVPNQYKVFTEFSRVLKKGGFLYLTTPNYSNLKSKLSYLLNESEYFNKLMPPNEADDIWLCKEGKIYFGHLFLTGIQKLRTLAVLNGFTLNRILPVSINKTSLVVLPFLYPVIFLSSLFTYQKKIRQNRRHSHFRFIQKIYSEILKHNNSIPVLTYNHLFIEFCKTHNLNEIDFSAYSKHTDTHFRT